MCVCVCVHAYIYVYINILYVPTYMHVYNECTFPYSNVIISLLGYIGKKKTVRAVEEEDGAFTADLQNVPKQSSEPHPDMFQVHREGSGYLTECPNIPGGRPQLYVTHGKDRDLQHNVDSSGENQQFLIMSPSQENTRYEFPLVHYRPRLKETSKAVEEVGGFSTDVLLHGVSQHTAEPHPNIHNELLLEKYLNYIFQTSGIPPGGKVDIYVDTRARPLQYLYKPSSRDDPQYEHSPVHHRPSPQVHTPQSISPHDAETLSPSTSEVQLLPSEPS